MSPNPPCARKVLNYPLYGAAFDPLNHDFLIVAGGGGSTSSGVPNKISLLDVSRYTDINEITDIELAKNEDSPTSLAIARSDTASLIAYAGINSSIADQNRGKNDHLRSFRIGLPLKKRKTESQEKEKVKGPTPSIPQNKALGRTALFRSATGPKNETYQRVLRVSPMINGSSQIAAVASGLATQSELISFRATESPDANDVISRINLEKHEAADLDITTTEENGQHVLAYATDTELYLQLIPQEAAKIKEPNAAHSEISGSGKIRSLRWLTSRYLVLLRNRAGRKGAEVAVLKTDKDYTTARTIFVKQLTKSTKQAVGLDAAALSKSSSSNQQFLVAVTGQDRSLEILTIDYLEKSGMEKFKPYTYISNIDTGPVTCVTFSRFIAPTMPVTKDTKPQYIRLATVGAEQNVSVFTIPLRPYPTTSKTPQYVLKSPSENLQNTINIFMALFVVGLTALFMQIFCEIRGALPPVLHAQSWLSPTWQERIARPYNFADAAISIPVIPESMPPFVETATSSLSSALESTTDAVRAAIDAAAESGDSILHHLVNSPDTAEKSIVIRDASDTELSTEVHEHDSDPVKDETLRKWEQLNEKEKKGWLKRLKDAGHWTENQGEGVLKGILFSELAGAVGAALRG